MHGIKIKLVSIILFFFFNYCLSCITFLIIIEIALSPNSKEVVIYSKSNNGWQQTQALTEHTSKVLSIDWAPQSNRIVTCGAVIIIIYNFSFQN